MKYIILLLFTSTLLFSAENVSPLSQMSTQLESYLLGNLGKLITLIGFAGTFIIYMMTHTGLALLIGIVLSLISGAMVGISRTLLMEDNPNNVDYSIYVTYFLQIIFLLLIVSVLSLFYQNYLNKKLKDYENSLTYL